MKTYNRYMPMGSVAAKQEHESTLMRISKVAAKPISAGAVAYGIATFMGQGAGVIPFFGYNMSIPMALGLSVLGGNLLAQSFSETVIEQVNEYRALGDFEKSLANPAITAAGALGLLYIGDGQIFNTSALINIIGVAMLSEVGGDYVYRNWIYNWVN